MSSAPATAMHDEFLVDDNPQKLVLDADLLSKFISRDGTVNIRGTVPIHVDDPLVLACFHETDNGIGYRPHYRAMRFVHNALDDTEVDDTTLYRISTAYRNRPLVMEPIPQQGVFEYTGLCMESTILQLGTSSDFGLAICTPLTANPIYTCTGFIPGTYKTTTPGSYMTVWFEERQYFMGYVYAVLPPTFRSAYQIDEETKFTWFIGDRSLSVMMGDLHEILAPRLNNNSELVCGVLSFIPCDAEVMEIAIVDMSREQGQRNCLWSWPNQYDQIQCLKGADINGNKWVPCPLVSIDIDE